MRHLKHHLGHLAMCAPMLIVGIFLIAGGAGIGVLVPIIACTVMMAMMMGGMSGGSDGNDPHSHR